MRYEKPRPPRFVVERVEGQELLRVPARRNWLTLAFLMFWLALWTMGGFVAVGALITDFSLFVVIWLGGWLFGWLVVGSIVLWQLGGAEILSVKAGDLHHQVRLPGYGKLRVYRGADVRVVTAAAAPMWSAFGFAPTYPPLFNLPFGSVKFRHGGRTIYLAAGLDETEGEAIATWLRERGLGRTAGETA